MKPRKQVLFFLGGATVALLAIVAIPSHPGIDPPEPSPPLQPPREVPDPPAYSSISEQLAEQRSRSEQLTWGRDPFRRPVASEIDEPRTETSRPQSRPRLTGISSHAGILWAIIDHELVQEGDLLSSGYTVEKIAGGTATLRRDQEELSLRLGDAR